MVILNSSKIPLISSEGISGNKQNLTELFLWYQRGTN